MLSEKQGKFETETIYLFWRGGNLNRSRFLPSSVFSIALGVRHRQYSPAAARALRFRKLDHNTLYPSTVSYQLPFY